MVSQTLSRSVTVVPAPVDIVVQDPYDIEVPKRAVVSNSGRYLAQAFDGRYRVFDIATGTKLVDRAGYNPNFSPTSRFIVADIGDADGIDFEVIDLVSREIVAKPTGPFVGWLYGDAFLIDGQSEFGRVGLRPTLISRGGVSPEGWWGATDVWRREGGADHDDALSIWASFGCHVCASWEATDVAIDLHAGYVLLSPESENDEAGRVYELATGYKGCCQTKQAAKSFILGNYKLTSLEIEKGWRASEPIRFSQIYDAVADRERSDPNVRECPWYPAAIALKGQLAVHREISAKRCRPSRGPGGRHNGSRGLGCQGARPLPRPGTSSQLLAELSRFGISTAPASAREVVSYSISDIEARYGTTTDDSERIVRRLVAEVPALKPHLASPDDNSSFPDGGDLSQGKIDIGQHIEGLWRWKPEDDRFGFCSS